MTRWAAEFFVIFFVRLAAVLVERHKSKLQDENELAAFEVKIELAKAARTRQEKQDAAKKITGAF